MTEDFYLTVETPAEDDADAPTVIENKKLLRPFEAVTDMYSTPARTGIDPVYVLAPFYFIFFGMMLSDAAYGICLLYTSNMGIEDGMQEALHALSCFLSCGISALYLRGDSEVPEEIAGRMEDMIRRRGTGEPLAYILGERYFMGLRFSVEMCIRDRITSSCSVLNF